VLRRSELQKRVISNEFYIKYNNMVLQSLRFLASYLTKLVIGNNFNFICCQIMQFSCYFRRFLMLLSVLVYGNIVLQHC
jgi:hypothetical protein